MFKVNIFLLVFLPLISFIDVFSSTLLFFRIMPKLSTTHLSFLKLFVIIIGSLVFINGRFKSVFTMRILIGAHLIFTIFGLSTIFLYPN